MLPLILVVTQTLLGWVSWRPRVFDMNHDAHDVNHWSSTKPFSSFPSFLSSPRRCWWNWLLSLRLCCRLQSTLRGHLSQQPLRRGGNWSWWNAISPFRVSLSCLAWLAVRVGAGLFLHRPASSWPAPMLILARLVSNWDVGNLVGKEGEEILTQFLPIEGDDGAWMLSWLRHPHHRHWADKDKQLWCFLLWREVHFMPRNTLPYRQCHGTHTIQHKK